MANSLSRGARLTALALATGTLVVAATGSAGAAPVAVPDVFGGSARGTAIHIEVNLPVPLNVPVLGNITSITQDISFTDGVASRDLSSMTSVAKAVLGDGTITPLNLAVESSLTGKPSDAKSLVSIPANPLISGGIGTITSSVAPDNATSALTSTSSSSLVDLKVGLPALPQLPVELNLEGLVEQLNGALDETTGTVTGAVNGALDTLNEATNGATGPVQEQVEQVEQVLTSTLDQLQQLVTNLANDPTLLSIEALKSSNTITRKGDMVESKAVSEVIGLSALAGLVTLDGLKTESFSSANGIKGAAAADTTTTVAKLKVGDLLELALTDKGLSGSLLGNTLPAAAQDAVNTAIGAINGVLATAGVNIVYGQKTTTVDPNGQSAASSSEGVGIVINPPVLNLAKPLVAIQLVPAGTAVNAARLPKPAGPPRVSNPRTSLPRTGVELPLFALLGTGVAGTALVIRRRRAVQA